LRALIFMDLSPGLPTARPYRTAASIGRKHCHNRLDRTIVAAVSPMADLGIEAAQRPPLAEFQPKSL
jgi:hypothetical protein